MRLEIERGGPRYTLGLADGVRFREQRRGAGVLAPATGDGRQDGQPQGVPERSAHRAGNVHRLIHEFLAEVELAFIDRRRATKEERVGKGRPVAELPGQSDARLEQLGCPRELALRHGEVPGAHQEGGPQGGRHLLCASQERLRPAATLADRAA